MPSVAQLATRLTSLRSASPPFASRPDLACKRPDVDPDLWHRRSDGAITKAQELCRQCPALDECAAWAIATRQQHGVWGATTSRERERLAEQVNA
jgi:WhiB family redox-sensing transcriptional regulator